MRRPFAAWRPGQAPALLRYGLAAACALGLLALTRALETPFHAVLFSIPIAAVAVLSLALGAGPGLFAAAVTGLGIWYLFLAPRGSFAIPDGRDVARLIAYFVASLAIAAATRLHDRARHGLAAANARAERALAEQRAQAAHLRAVTENSPEVIARFDRQLRHTFLNEYGARLYGISVEGALGKTSAELGMPAEKVAFWRSRFEQVFATGVQQTVDFSFDGPTSGRRFFSSLFVPERDEAGAVSSVLTITRDVTDQKRAEEARRELLRTAQLLQVLSAATPDALHAKDLDGRMLFANEATLTAIGKSGDKVLGRTDLDWCGDPEQAQAMMANDLEVMSTERAQVFEEWLTGPKGLRCYQSTKAPLRNERGEVVGIVGVSRDVTEIKRAEDALRDSEARYRNLFANMTEEVHLWKLVRGEGGSIVTWQLADANPPALRTWGQSLEQIRGKTPDEIFGPGATEHYLPIVQKVYRQGAPCSYEDFFPHLGRHFRFTTIPWGEYFITTGADITAVKQAAAELERSNALLLEADRRKNEFLAVLSHELRNPLSPIRNSLFILERAAPGGEQALRARQVIERQTRHLTRLVEDLLDVTRITRGKISLHRERVDLAALARRAAEDHRALFAENGVAFEVAALGGQDQGEPGGQEPPLWVDGDPTRLAQVIGNILSNSAKFTPRGGRTVLSVEANARGQAAVRVRDDGTGIAPETLQHVFEPFVQATQTLERSRGGLGLGLALVKGIVEMHGGTVAVASAGEGRGAEFTVMLPLLQAPTRPSLEEAHP